MKLKTISFAIVSFCLTAAAHAHEGGEHEHLKGTVQAIDATSITVAGKEGKASVATIDAATKFERGKDAAKREDVKVGEHVTVQTAKAGDTVRATVVKIGAEHDEHGEDKGKDGEHGDKEKEKAKGKGKGKGKEKAPESPQ